MNSRPCENGGTGKQAVSAGREEHGHTGQAVAITLKKKKITMLSTFTTFAIFLFVFF